MSAPVLGRCLRWSIAALAAAMLTGCASTGLNSARENFYQGRYDKAAADLADKKVPGKDSVLFLMERGTILQANGDYDASSKDYIDAYDQIEKLGTYSVSKGGASMVVNDTVQDYRGMPYERTLLHTFTAKNHLAQANWENAAVEARRTINSLSPEAKGDYPDDAYARYMAGFSLEMIGDRSNAALQYRNANELLSNVVIDDQTGRLYPKPPPSTNENIKAELPKFDRSPWTNELVCFVSIGRAPHGDEVMNRNWSLTKPLYAEILSGGKTLGRSYNLTDTIDLAFTTSQKDAAKKLVKTVSRVAVKEGIAYQVEKDNELLGALVRFVLIGLMEHPDERNWETLPRWLQVARVPCPPNLTEYDLVLKTSSGVEVGRSHVTKPITRHYNTYVSFYRDVLTR